ASDSRGRRRPPGISPPARATLADLRPGSPRPARGRPLVGQPARSPSRRPLGASDHASVVRGYPGAGGLVSGIRDSAETLSDDGTKTPIGAAPAAPSEEGRGRADGRRGTPRRARRDGPRAASWSGFDGRAGVLEAQQGGQLLG